MNLNETKEHLTKIAIKIKDKKWGRVQCNSYDSILGKYFYSINTFDELYDRMREMGYDMDSEEVSYYESRLFKKKVADCDEETFCLNENVKPHESRTNKDCDFYINGEPFDLKGTRLPNSLIDGKTIDDVINNPCDVINWMYENQSGYNKDTMTFKRGSRGNNQNRIFLIVYSKFGTVEREKPLHCAWKKKSDVIREFCENFDKVKVFNYTGDHKPFKESKATIIWLLENEPKKLDYKIYYE